MYHAVEPAQLLQGRVQAGTDEHQPLPTKLLHVTHTLALTCQWNEGLFRGLQPPLQHAHITVNRE